MSLFSPHIAAAAEKSTITVQPASLNIDLSNEYPDNLSMITLTNNYDQPITLSAEFKGIDAESGRIIPTGEPGNVITETLKLSETIFVIPANSQYFLKISAKDNQNLTAGGHYATLVIREAIAETSSSSINSMISVGIFLVKRDGAKDDIVLTKHVLSKPFLSMPKSLDLEFLNDGNIHITPRASITISSGAKTYTESILNQNSKVILPTKRYGETIQLNISNAPKFFPKSASLLVTYRAEGSDATKSYQQNFIIIPKLFWLCVGIILAFVSYLAIFQRKFIQTKINKLQQVKILGRNNHH